MNPGARSSGVLDGIARLQRSFQLWRAAARTSPAAREAALRRVDRLAALLDAAVTVPGLRRRVGLDAVFGLVPVVGDLAGAAIACWIVAEAWRLGAPPRLLLRMLGTIAIDTGLGAVPIVGDIFDAVWMGNRRNAALLREWLTRGN